MSDRGVLDNVQILKTWHSGDWIVHKVSISENLAAEFGSYLKGGKWYVHFWEPGHDKVLVVFKDKTFEILYSNKSTWHDAVEYGKSLGIPEIQLDFVIE
ncbi:MAG: hypothetical protein AAB442_02815 [Patescibacteria group bacterium]